MSIWFKAAIVILVTSGYCFSQDPMAIVGSSWERSVQKAPKPVISEGPAKALTGDDKFFRRQAREARTDVAIEPELALDARRAAMEKAVQEARAPRADDVTGYRYIAELRNKSGKTAEIIYWEYRFTEIAHPANLVRRQFLCGLKLKDGDKRALSAFTLLGPSNSIDVESLAKATDKLFNEEVVVNRIEFSDGSILQRPDWKYADVKAAVQRATSTPWGNEVCRAL